MTIPSQAAQTAQPDAPQPAVSVNGTAPGADPAAGECVECVTSGERALAVLGVVIGLAIAAIAIDLGTGGKLSGLVGLGRGEAGTDDNTGP
jgi:hypothetical protein